MSELVPPQPLLLVRVRGRRVPPDAGTERSRVRSGSSGSSSVIARVGPRAFLSESAAGRSVEGTWRVSPEAHGSQTWQAGQVSRVSSAGAPQAGHRRAGLTPGFYAMCLIYLRVA